LFRFDAASRDVAIELGTRLARLRNPELSCMQIAARLLECSLRLQPLILFLCALDDLLGFAGCPLRSVMCVDRVAFVGCALCNRSGQRCKEGRRCSRVRAYVLDLYLQQLHAGERLRDIGVAALELFCE
jgi:hypothetical protein